MSGIERSVSYGDVSKVVALQRQEEWYHKACALSLYLEAKRFFIGSITPFVMKILEREV